MEWTNEVTLKLIRAYRDKRILWNSDHEYFTDKYKRYSAWGNIAKELETTVDSVKRKIASLLATYRKERRIREARGETSRWFAFDSMHEILHDRYKCKEKLTNNLNLGNCFSTTQYILDNGTSEINTLVEFEGNGELSEYPCLKTEADFHFEDSRISESSLAEENATDPLRDSQKSEKRSATFGKSISRRRKLEGNKSLFRTQNLDECSAFGEYIASKLKKYNSYTRALVEYRINDILFKADIGKLTIESDEEPVLADNASTSKE